MINITITQYSVNIQQHQGGPSARGLGYVVISSVSG